MTQKLNILILFALLLACTTGCQHAVEEIDFESSLITITAQSSLANLIANSTLKDGSYDNILDNASSITVKLPVNVLANSTELSITSTLDFDKIEQIYNEEPFLQDSLHFEYPITVIFADYSELVVERKIQLDQIVSESIEGGEDPDIECISYQYPFKLSTYDRLNQLASTQAINSDLELYQFFTHLNADEIAAFDYPFIIHEYDGNPINIDGNSSLETLLNNSIGTCDEEDSPYYTDDDIVLPTTTLSILLTDAPFPTDLIAEANIQINQIRLKATDDSEEENFLLLSEEEFSFNLLELTNGLTATLVDIQVPTGNYNEIRLLVSEASVLLNDGEFFDLKVPSGSTSGLKVKLNPALEIVEGNDYQILLDFDVSQSFVVKGNPNSPAGIKGFNFKPVIKAANLSNSGSLSGEVTEESTSVGIDGAEISVMAADTLNTTTFTNENGEYKILGLTEGVYEIIADHNDYESLSKDNINVVIQTNTEVDFELTPE